MKKYILISVCLWGAGFPGCHKKPSLSIPACVLQKIEEIKAQSKWNPPASVEEYSYQGKKVFLFSSPCCDHYNEAFDEGCNYVCAPSGGFTGRGDGKCTEFKEAAQLVRVVWKDER